MKIILSPAKKMNTDIDALESMGIPTFIDKSAEILTWLRQKSEDELKALWKCNDKIVEQNINRLECMDLYHRLTPAILSYEGIAYQYMAPAVFEQKHLSYIQEHLRIISAFYGVVKPMDGVTPYRLEMQSKATVKNKKDLYDFWENCLYDEVRDADGVIINLASKEYSKCIEKYLTKEDTYITCVFGELVNGKVVQKGTYAKMARGEMVRFMAEEQITDPKELKKFERLNYRFREELSTESKYVFIRS